MPRVDVPTELLEAELERYLASSSDGPADARAGAARHRVLPLLNDFVGCWALDMTGLLVFFPWEAPEDLEPVSENPQEAIGTHAALALGSMRFPALSAIRPSRPADAIPCITCDGSGRIAGAPDHILCACGGLGWLPPSADGATGQTPKTTVPGSERPVSFGDGR